MTATSPVVGPVPPSRGAFGRRVGFLFNHYAPHQVPHAAPIAFELSRRRPDLEVVVAYSTETERAMIEAIGALYPGQRCSLVRLDPAWWYRIVDPVVSKVALARKNRILKDNLDFFAGLDVLVAPERHCRRLKTKYGLADLALIHTRHGAGDREGTTDQTTPVFDFVLLPGRKYADRFDTLGYLRPGHYAVIGWPKFDVVRALIPGTPRLFANDRPVVVYNPHFDQSVASYGRMGRAILEYFAASRDYNLIFAPHAVLFQRRWRHGATLPSRFRAMENILVDTGSPRLADMTYMLAADLYLGDVSSQVYEFLLKPRPCVFLNAHGVDWRGNPYYAHWKFGPVVEDGVQELGPVLKRAFVGHDRYLDAQREGFAHTFHDEPGTTAAERGADAIARFLRLGPSA